MDTAAAKKYLEQLRRGEDFHRYPSRWAEELDSLQENLCHMYNLPPPTTDLWKGEIDLAKDLLTSMVLIKARFNGTDPTTPSLVDEDDEDVPDLVDCEVSPTPHLRAKL
ncbi:hypothetical protein DFH07DRAFT_768995 [Mycena maculata]|uniref:Uncharacterized protein n=1 Tax=Mycena maculata TaxID=230809 RepID=A0AAD7JQ70_9AGAR|nr:hypothetical protein DFH07DRAFT_768995 [Mycena maculata]